MIARSLVSLRKELTLLGRDRAGLAILFLMPAALVLVITLIQNNVLESQSEIEVLVVNQDDGSMGQAIADGLRASEFFAVRSELSGAPVTPEGLQHAVARGDFKLGVIVHESATRSLHERVTQLLEGGEPRSNGTDDVTLVLDPTIPTALESSIDNALQFLVHAEEIRVLMEELGGALELELPDGEATRAIGKSLQLGTTRLTAIRQRYASEGGRLVTPNAVQHNVPAWTLFGMFFIVIPISSALLKERNDGTLRRMMIIPGAHPAMVLSKVVTYVLVNLGQLALMLLIGVAALPRFGAPVLELGDRPGLILLVGICASLAATGFGLMLGAIARTHEQASTVGSISIIIAAALGGIMVPVFLMPGFIQPWSGASPLHWGHDAFIGLFVRGSGLAALAPDMIRLLTFSAATLSIAIVFLSSKAR